MKALVLVVLGACCPGWSVTATLRDPANHRIPDATVAVACPEIGGTVAHANFQGTTVIGGLGAFPYHCDLVIAKPGYRTHRIAYADICPPDTRCAKEYTFELVLEADEPPR